MYRFPSSQSSSPMPEIRHSWPIFHQAHHSQYSVDHVCSEQSVILREPSTNSNESFNSNSHTALRVTNENLHPSRGTSPSSSVRCELPNRRPKPLYYRSCSDRMPRTTKIVSPKAFREIRYSENIDLSAGCGERITPSLETPSSSVHSRPSCDTVKRDMAFNSHRSGQIVVGQEVNTFHPVTPRTTKHHLRRWMKSVRHKSPARKGSLQIREQRWSLDDSDPNEEYQTSQDRSKRSQDKHRNHKKSSSWSSSGIITAVKSATAGLSVVHSQKNRLSIADRKSNRSSELSGTTKRMSFRGEKKGSRVFDEAAWDRARQRRRTIEEILSSEESYVADLKVLINVGCHSKVVIAFKGLKTLSRSISPFWSRRQAFSSKIIHMYTRISKIS